MDTLAVNLYAEKGIQAITIMKNQSVDIMDLLCKSGLYPYQLVDDPQVGSPSFTLELSFDSLSEQATISVDDY